MTLVTAAATAAAAQSGYPVAVRVISVLAADTNQGMDTRLQAMAPQLNSLFHYSTYRLLSVQEVKTNCGRSIVFTLPGGRILHLEPQAIEGNMIAMQLMLFQGEQPMMTTALKLTNRGRLMVGGPRYQQGMLIISVSIATDVTHVAPPPTSSQLAPVPRGAQNLAPMGQPHQPAASASPQAQ
ncbi:MAG: hypothetical protein WA005_13795 [Candidatus Binataceae bacterium]